TPLFSRMVVFWVMLSYRKKRGLSIFLRDRVYTKYFTLSHRHPKLLTCAQRGAGKIGENTYSLPAPCFNN
ncbi:MAG: hypothetical protein SOZ52_09295, partial [Pyramidobacter sp.]|nr:hypothetical protein [Pyramidobacter sp.]